MHRWHWCLVISTWGHVTGWTCIRMAWGAPDLKAAIMHVENAMHHLNDALKGPRAPVRHASAEVMIADAPFLPSEHP